MKASSLGKYISKITRTQINDIKKVPPKPPPPILNVEVRTFRKTEFLIIVLIFFFFFFISAGYLIVPESKP